MGRRRDIIARSIRDSILREEPPPSSLCTNLCARFHIYKLEFTCIRPDLFHALKTKWEISDEQFRTSLQPSLVALGDMGYSGSTFFSTEDTRYLIKSIPRRFEHTFFRDDLLVPYAEHMTTNEESFLVRIVAFLECVNYSLGTVLGTAPSHHIVMENIKQNKFTGSNGRRNSEDDDGDDDSVKLDWETFDLKPMSYFYPERDVAGGALASEATKSKLADAFDDKILLTPDQAEHFREQLARDTLLLVIYNAVDYSLFLVRTRLETLSSREGLARDGHDVSWREGIRTADGKYVYRAAILDFFWAKHKTHAKLMTGLIQSYNLVDRQGPMSVTTTAPEYRDRFLKMCHELIEVAQT